MIELLKIQFSDIILFVEVFYGFVIGVVSCSLEKYESEENVLNMHQLDETLYPGAIIGGHYLVIDLIGTGGFSAVYLVQDQQRENSYYALKEVIAKHADAKERFIFEWNVLKNLTHPALPRVHGVFENEEHNRLYMLMDYVEGPNLEMLRSIQPGQRFSVSVIGAIIVPIVDAIGYLHQQNPPIIHRDIKPANIIAPVAGGTTILVDFGIAKKYEAQGTTSAMRYGSPGYGAPEQYTTGTNTRTDIYGLGATLYTLLTGEIPSDALQRLTLLSNDMPDPLRPVNELVPSVPGHISKAIQRAMSINIAQRFATVQEFGQALQGGMGQQPHITDALNSIGATSPQFTSKVEVLAAPYSRGKSLSVRSSRKRLLLPALLVVLLVIGMAAGFWSLTGRGRNSSALLGGDRTTATIQRSSISPVTNPHVTTTVVFTANAYPHLAASYSGTIDDLQANVPSQMMLTRMLQSGGHISGFISAMHINGTYNGFLDTSKHIYFTVGASKGLAPLSFTGAVRTDGVLAGTFCEIDQDGQCTTNGVFGLWNVAPGGTTKG
jgi:eukaryotic-like serine/threonine-protein kinase